MTDTLALALDEALTDDAPPALPSFITAIRADDMFVDPTYQRPLDLAWARRHADAYDPTLLGVIDVSDRGEDASPRYAIVNGQHRRAIVTLAHPEGERAHLVCTVHRGLTVTDEANLFHQLDITTRRLTGWDRWHARRGANDPMVSLIDELLAPLNLRAVPGQQDGCVGCVGALEKLVNLGGANLLTSTLQVLAAAYGRNWNGYYAPIVTGVGLLLHHYGDLLDPQRLVEALGKSTPQQVRAQGAGLRELMPGTMPRLVAQVLVNRMNSGRGRKLPDVRDQLPANPLTAAANAARNAPRAAA